MRLLLLSLTVAVVLVLGGSGAKSGGNRGELRDAVSDILADYMSGGWQGAKCEYFNHPPTADEFAEIKRKGRPVVFRNAMKVFGEKVAKWGDTADFSKRFGHAGQRASYFDIHKSDEKFGNTPVDNGNYLRMPFHRRTTLKEVLEFEKPGRSMYMEQGAIFDTDEPLLVKRGKDGAPVPVEGDMDARDEAMQDLLDEWRMPDFMPSMKVQSIALWAGRVHGDRPKVSSTHYDPVDNVFLLLKGRKSFGMYEANHVAAISPRFMRHKQTPNPDSSSKEEVVMNSIQDNFSPVDPHKPDYKTFPRARKARPTICELEAGDALFMPAFTFHSVQSWGSKEEGRFNKLNMGLNLWFEGDQRFQVAFEALMTILQGANLGELHEVKDNDILAESGNGRPFEDL